MSGITSVTRYPSGVSTVPPEAFLSTYPIPSPQSTYEYFNDFSTYNSGDWTVTSTNSGTTALADGEGGWLLLTTGSSSTNYQANQLKNLSWYMTTGYRHWFGINFKLGDLAHTAFQAGWIDTLAGPLTPGSGVYFSKTDASSTLNLILNNASATTTIAVGTLVANTFASVGWYFNAAPSPTMYVYSSIGLTLPLLWETQQQYQGGVRVASIGSNSNANPTLLTNLPAATVGHTMGFGLSTGTNSAHTLTIDHIFSGSAVNRF